MVEVTVPSGHKVTIRDQFMRADRKEGERGLVIVVQADGTRRIQGNAFTDISSRILSRMIVSWDYEFPPPSNAQGHLQDAILDRLPDDDAQALERVVAPWVNRIVRQVTTDFTHTPTGVRVMVTSPADAQILAVHEDFEQDGAETSEGPKPGQTPTGISSSESPALSGPTPQE